VAAAAALIFERDVAGITWDDVQRAAAVNASQRYHHFLAALRRAESHRNDSSADRVTAPPGHQRELAAANKAVRRQVQQPRSGW
jgi:hypothetical protein